MKRKSRGISIIQLFRIICVFIVPFSLYTRQLNAIDLMPERRQTRTDTEFGWLISPTPVNIQGIGSVVPVTAILTNFYESTDLMATKSFGGTDLEITATGLLELPLYTEHLLFYGGSFETKMPFKQYNRGIDSDPDTYVLPYRHSKGYFSQFKLNFLERRTEFFIQYNTSTGRSLKIYDADGNEFENVDTSESSYDRYSAGALLDFTDDRFDPRNGIRFGIERNFPPNQSEDNSDYHVTDIDLSFYFPFFGKDTLVLNIFRSYATVTREGIVDIDELREKKGLGCVPGMPLYEQCYAAETKQIMEIWAANKYGTATSLGGTNRLRAYDAGRFRAGNTAFYALEYRYNFSSEEREVNLFFLGGIKTLFQLAAFAEIGTVNDDPGKLDENLKPSYGAGFRAIISGLVYRFDVSTGNEGLGITLFIDYPFELNPITG